MPFGMTPEIEAYLKSLGGEGSKDWGKNDWLEFLKGQISSGQFDPKMFQAYGSLGGGLDTLMRAMTAGMMGYQQQQATESQGRTNAIRQALMAPGAEGGPSAISNMLNRKSFFNPYSGSQQVPSNPLAGVQFPGMGGGSQGTPQPPAPPAPPAPQPPPAAPPPVLPEEPLPPGKGDDGRLPGGDMVNALMGGVPKQAPVNPNTQNQYLAFLEALRRSGTNG